MLARGGPSLFLLNLVSLYLVLRMSINQAEAAFMVARGMVREAHGSLEALQGRLKEVRDRLDRISREEAHYLELATLEHKLLQVHRRLADWLTG